MSRTTRKVKPKAKTKSQLLRTAYFRLYSVDDEGIKHFDEYYDSKMDLLIEHFTKLLQKKNTFNDFIYCSKFLIEQKMTSASHLYAMGGSAGGLLMGAVINMAPALFNGVIAAVPFVDVINTMLDESIPLTTGEFDEWGNPKNKDSFDYMMSYSPYDNVKAQDYPHMLVTTGYWDSQVQYWEPAKWVAKLRTLKTDNTVLFLDTNMEAGHSGASGRFDALKDVAKEYTFMLELEGKLN